MRIEKTDQSLGHCSTLEIDSSIEIEDGTAYLAVVLGVDGSLLVEPDDYAIDLQQLHSSLSRDGEYFIFSCTCGDAQCGGIYHAVQVSRSAGKVQWIVQRL